ncbi:MAG: hypothetical protein AAF581_18245 [Planctomycetota bacterium]
MLTVEEARARYYPRVPTHEDAGPLWGQVNSVYTGESLALFTLPDDESADFANDRRQMTWPEVRSLLTEHANAVDLAWRAARERPSCSTPINESGDWLDWLPIFEGRHPASLLVDWKTRLALYDGDSDLGAQGVEAMFALARQCKDPSWISFLEGCAYQKRACELLELLLALNPTEATLDRLLAVISDQDLRPDSALVADIALGHTLFTTHQQHLDELLGESLPMWQFKLTGLLDREHAHYVAWLSGYLDALQRPLPKVRARVLAVDQEFPRTARFVPTKVGQIDMVRLIDRFLRAQSLLAVTTAALQVELHSSRTGSLPMTWDAQDPVTGAPLKYMRTGDRYKIWAAGADGKDDGGERDNDVVFEVRREKTR